MRRLVRALVGVGCAITLAPHGLNAQIELRTSGASATVGGRVQLQFATTSVTDETTGEFLVRRARLNFTVNINDFISGRVQPEFGLSITRIRDAWMRLSFSSALRLTAGQFKQPIDLFALTSSTQTLVIERTGLVPGAGSCPGVIFCTYSAFSAILFFSDRDVGFMFDGTAGAFYYGFAVSNGNGPGQLDDNGTKTYTGRLQYEIVPDVSLGVNAAYKDYTNDSTMTSDYAPVVGADLDVGNFTQGVHFRVGALVGDNWRNLDASGSASRFATAQGILSYKFLAHHPRVEALEPLFRVSYGNADTDADADSGWLWTPGVQMFFSGRNKIAANLDIYKQAELDTQYSLKVQMYFFF